MPVRPRVAHRRSGASALYVSATVPLVPFTQMETARAALATAHCAAFQLVRRHVAAL